MLVSVHFPYSDSPGEVRASNAQSLSSKGRENDIEPPPYTSIILNPHPHRLKNEHAPCTLSSLAVVFSLPYTRIPGSTKVK